MNRFLLLTIILLGTLSCTTDNRVYSLRNELIENGNSRFYKDFDIFSRKGIEEITSDTLLRPFFKVQIDIDSVILLTIFKNGEKAKEIIVPKDETMLYDFDGINDGPRHNYYKIFKDSLVVFGYDNKIDEVETWDRDSIFLFELLPRMISVMTRDTLYHYFQDCLNIKVMDEDDTEIKIAKSDFRKKSFSHSRSPLI